MAPGAVGARAVTGPVQAGLGTHRRERSRCGDGGQRRCGRSIGSGISLGNLGADRLVAGPVESFEERRGGPRPAKEQVELLLVSRIEVEPLMLPRVDPGDEVAVVGVTAEEIVVEAVP